MHLVDPLAWFVSRTGYFRGKWRLNDLVMKWRPRTGIRTRAMAGGGRIECRLAIPYEVMVWLRQEEECELQVLRSLLSKGQTFVDCGANIGLWTMTAADAVGAGGRVVAFEPSPTTFRRLEQHVRDSYPQVILKNAAVGNAEGTVCFDCPEEHNLARIVGDNHDGAIRVSCVRLDDVLERESVAGIKMDVEGVEFEALEGASTVLERCRPWLIVEFNTIHAQINRLGDWPVHQLLTGLGYEGRLITDLKTASGPVLAADWKCNGYRNLYYVPVRR
jgi:FkbM family methyltransferase